MTRVLEIPEALERRLQKAAAEQQTSPEEVLLKLADKYLEEDASDSPGQTHRARVRAAGDYVQAKNAELYKRLA